MGEKERGMEGKMEGRGMEGKMRGKERMEIKRQTKKAMVRRMGRRGITRMTIRIRTKTRRERRMGRRMGRRLAAVARAPTCCLTLFTTSSGASTWPWNRHLRSVSKTGSITEKIELDKNGHEGTNWLYSLISGISSMK